MTRLKTDFVANAQKAWGTPPDWVLELAKEANRITARKVAERLGYSNGVISCVFGNNYRGDMAKVEAKVRGALMGETVICPVVGEIGRDMCLEHQALGNTGASSIRARIYRACRNGCPHSRISKGD